MTQDLEQIKNELVEGLSGISAFWGFPKGMGAIFAVLYLSPSPLSLDELVAQTGLTKGAISTNTRALSRMGLIRPVTRLGDRKDYYEAETDFYRSIRAILQERQNGEFDRAVASVKAALGKLEAGSGESEAERAFLTERVRALNDFFNALDALASAVSRLNSLGLGTVQNILKILK
jgi:HTH-type transcriptional regulator, glycine betaine synthesis regulator